MIARDGNFIIPLQLYRKTVMPFIKGKSGNPLGRYPSIKNIQVTAKKHAEDALGVLIEVMQDITAPADSRVVAANSVLDRATGKSGEQS